MDSSTADGDSVPTSQASAEIRRDMVRLEELNAAKRLLWHTDQLLGEFRTIDVDADLLTVVLATGAEKLLKLTFGMLTEDEIGTWPTKEVRNFGHRLAELDGVCRSRIAERRGLATQSGVFGQAQNAVETDPLLPQILGLLQRYAINGRFYNLDYLGGPEPSEPSPRALWHDIDISIFGLESDLVINGDVDDLIAQRGHLLQHSVRCWWWFYYQAWAQNLCGPVAREHFGEISPPFGNPALPSRSDRPKPMR